MYTSPRKSLFQLLVFVCIGTGIVYGGSFAYEAYQKSSVDVLEADIRNANTRLEKIGQADWFNKLEFARRVVQEKQAQMSWTTRIKTISDVLQELQGVTYKGGVITLNDFSVTMDQVTVKGETLNIALLYHTIEGSHTSLFDTFKKLSFVRNIKIREYQRAGSNSVSFVLTADLRLHDLAR